MKKVLFFFALFVSICGSGQKIIAGDVYNFWNAYDKIVAEKDTAQQLNLIKTLYIDKGTPGLDGIMRARRYTAEEYIYAINHYPRFWNSVRANTLKANKFSAEINDGIAKLKKIYPQLKPVNTYFEIGVLRTGGTTIDDMLLIGAELALADRSVVSEEFAARYPHLRAYFDTDPIKNVAFQNIHEYIHTQQRETIGKTLLAQTVMEGVAEYLAEIALGQKSPNPQIAFGFRNEEKIKREYVKEMFSPNIYNWIMNNPNNQFGMRDLGYFVGYAIAKNYYERANNKQRAVKEMIELDYNNDQALVNFVEKSKYFADPLAVYKTYFEKQRPIVTGVEPFENGSSNVDSRNKVFTLTFSEPMDTGYRNFELGPLGENNLLKISKVVGFSDDGRRFTFEAELQPDKQYQLLINYEFRSATQFPLVPYLIDFKTAR